jgi:hypothetical protein
MSSTWSVAAFGLYATDDDVPAGDRQLAQIGAALGRHDGRAAAQC